MSLLLSRYAIGLLGVALILVAVWSWGYSTAAQRYREQEAARIALAQADALRQQNALDRLRADRDAARNRKPIIVERIKEVANAVKPDDQCTSLPEPLRVLWDVRPADIAPARSAGRPNAAVRRVAADGR